MEFVLHPKKKVNKFVKPELIVFKFVKVQEFVRLCLKVWWKSAGDFVDEVEFDSRGWWKRFVHHHG